MGKSACMTMFSLFFGVIIFVGMILFAVSFKVIEINQIGIQKDTISRKIDDSHLYKAGRYFAGCSKNFITYDLTWQYIFFGPDSGANSGAVIGKTSDGSSISLEISLTYKIKPEFAIELYTKYPGQNHVKDMVTVANDQILKTITEYDQENFKEDRQAISTQMSLAISSEYKKKFHCELTMFLLRGISLEDTFEEKIIQGQISNREADTADQAKYIDIIEGEINVIESNAEVRVSELIAQADSESLGIIAEAEAAGDGEILRAEALGYMDFLDADGLDFSNEQLIRFINLFRMMNNKNLDVYFGLPSDNIFQL